MATVSVHTTKRSARLVRWDAEYYGHPDRRFLEEMFQRWPEWSSLEEASLSLTSGHTPLRHDLESGDSLFLTVETVDPLFVDEAKAKRVWRHQVDGELRRVRLEPGDVLITIKRRIANSCPVVSFHSASAVNQDIAVMKPKDEWSPEFVAAVLVSRVGQSQTNRLQTEQINPYISVGSLGRVLLPYVSWEEQDAVARLVRERLAAFRQAEQFENEASEALRDYLHIPSLKLHLQSRTELLSNSKRAGRLDSEFFCTRDLFSLWESPVPLTALSDPRVSRSVRNGATPGAEDYNVDGIPIIKVGDITSFGLAYWGGARVHPGAPSVVSRRGDVQVGDVLMLCAAHHVRYIGECGVLQDLPNEGKEGCQAVGELMIITPAEAMMPEVLAAYFHIEPVQVMIQRLVRGQSAHLYPRDLAHLPVPIVDWKLQEEVRERFDLAASARKRAERLLTTIKTQIERMVLGRTDSWRV